MIEAMLTGCPVIAFPRGSAPELVEQGVTGFLVDDAAEMAEVIRTRLDDFDRERCRARAIERFSRDRMVDAYEAYYRKALGASPRAAKPIVASG
jgi:glycosyltransferase involved in cell wall biosynthesis